MRIASLCLLLLGVGGVVRAEDDRALTITLKAPTVAFASAIRLDPRLGLIVQVVPPAGARLSAELIESPGKTTKLELTRDEGSPGMVARLPVSAPFSSGHIHFTVQQGDLVEHQFRQFAIRPSARTRPSALQSNDGRVTLFVQSERLDPETSVILADVGAVGPPLPTGTSAVVGPFSISTTRPGRNDRALGAILRVAMPRDAAVRRAVRVLRLDERQRAWAAIESRIDVSGSVQADVATFGIFVVVQP
jgi:hypothetical protein